MMRAETQQWWDQPQADLHTAAIVLAAERYYAVSLFAQQAAEKALKALYIERRSSTPPPKTHDLDFLAREVGAPPSLEPALDALADTISRARYPDASNGAPVHLIGQPEAEAHLDAAKGIVAWTDSQL